VLAPEAGGDGAQTEENELGVPAPAPPAQSQAGATPLARFITGLDEAFARTRLETHLRALFSRARDPRTMAPTLRALDALLDRWTPGVAAVADPLPRMAVALVRTGVALACLVDAALQALEAETVPPSRHVPNPGDPPSNSGTSQARPTVAALGAASFGLAAVARIHTDQIQPRESQKHRRRLPTPG
jgi:hypothetical protein